jgi:2-oxo-4-hydroxy-4-carboxy-5-ureidoimidazoline decarboxylase
MTIAEFDHLSEQEKRDALFKCCGSANWVNKMLAVLPAEDLVDLLQDADEQWLQCAEPDWLEAFTHHPKIGDKSSLKEKFATTASWASNEQAGVSQASDDVIDALAKGNDDYFNKFGFIFIVCATGKSAEEMLGLLMLRLPNDPEKEIRIAAEEQGKITAIRLTKLFA